MFRTILIRNNIGMEVVISEKADDYVLDESGLDLGTVQGSHNMTQYIDLIGKNVDSTVLQPRSISITGYIIGETELEIQKRKNLLNRLFNPMTECTLEYGEYALDFKPDNSIAYSTDYKDNNEYWTKFMVQGTAPMPMFRLKKYNDYRQSEFMKPKFKFPFSIPKEKGIMFAYLAFESLTHTPNRGDVESGFLFELTVLEGFEGTISNPKILNETNGEFIAFNLNMVQGDSLKFSTILGQQFVEWTHEGITENGMKYISEDSYIDAKLALGFNTIKLLADKNEGALVGRITFTPRFLEIEGDVIGEGVRL